MKKFAVSGLIFLIALFIAISVLLYLQRNSRSTIFCSSLDDSIRPRNYCLMNPFRGKKPEILAETILQELKNGNPNVIVPYLNDLTEDRRNHFLENEEKYQVESWRIADREDSENKISLMYWVSRRNYFDGHLENISFFFELEDNEWKLKQFDATY
jgi:hypothetical protein